MLLKENTLIYFTKEGHISPAEGIETSWLDFEEQFVSHASFSEVRVKLYHHLKVLVKELPNFIGPYFEIWINGSFVNKYARPRDLDAVIWIPLHYWDTSKMAREKWVEKYGQLKERLDLYFQAFIEIGHENREEFLIHQKYWRYMFTKSKKNRRTKRSFPKGFIIIKHE